MIVSETRNRAVRRTGQLPGGRPAGRVSATCRVGGVHRTPTLFAPAQKAEAS